MADAMRPPALGSFFITEENEHIYYKTGGFSQENPRFFLTRIRKIPLVYTKSKVPRETSDLERKKEPMDVELSRQALTVARFSRVAMLLCKPGKQNGIGFF